MFEPAFVEFAKHKNLLGLDVAHTIRTKIRTAAAAGKLVDLLVEALPLGLEAANRTPGGFLRDSAESLPRKRPRRRFPRLRKASDRKLRTLSTA